MFRNDQGNLVTSMIINPNALDGEIYDYKKYNWALDDILTVLKITNYRIIRADFRLDSIDKDFFHKFWKIHSYLLSGLAMAYGVDNDYLTKRLKTRQNISLSVKSQTFQCEFYDKAVESKGKDIVTARLEERSISKGSIDDIRTEFGSVWKIRWRDALNNLYAVTEYYNQILIDEYRDKVIGKGLKRNEFLSANADRFFTKNQLVRFLYAVGDIENPENAANNFINRYRDKCDIELYSLADCRHVVSEIMRATCDFFDAQNISKMIQNEAV
jgi:hypothetical protein